MQQVATIVDVQGERTRNGSIKYTIKTAEGQEWVTFDGAISGQYAQYKGQGPIIHECEISPAKDPKYGMNYYGNGVIGPAPAGMAATAAAVPIASVPVPAGVPVPVPAAAAVPINDTPSSRYSDAEQMLFARKDGLAAAAQIFAGVGEDLDWQKFWGAAEAFSKFVVLRQHGGWVPGIEILPTGDGTPGEVVAAVNDASQTGATVTQGPPVETPVADASVAQADATKDVVWD